MFTRPPFSYVGGKQGIAERVTELLHPHDHYVEPYAGSLAVLLAKAPSMMETVNDLDRDLANFWRVLRDRPDDLVTVCALTPHSRDEFRDASNRSMDELEQARRTWVLLSQGRGGRLTRTGWRTVITAAAKKSLPGYLDSYLARMLDCAERLRGVSIESIEALDVIRSYDAPGTAFYVDPPYLPDVRRGALYRHEMSTEDHRQMLAVLQECTGHVVLSGYGHPLYDKALGGWHREEIPSRATDGTSRIEVLWSNRPPAHAFDFGGR